MLKLAIAGTSGRMGRLLIETALQAEDLKVTVALDAANSAMLGLDCGAPLGRTTGVKVSSDLDTLMEADVLIDFTRPDASLHYARQCAALGVKMVVGTTGFDDAGKVAMRAAANRTAIVMAPNMSVGVNVTLKLLELAAGMLRDYDVEIVESHHRHKVDAPSGTALAMGEVIASAQGQRLADVAVYAREGLVGERRKGSIGFSAIRGGDIVGDHVALFAGIGERIEITHRSASRANYVEGSLRAARFLRSRATGLFDMQDVLGLR